MVTIRVLDSRYCPLFATQLSRVPCVDEWIQHPDTHEFGKAESCGAFGWAEFHVVLSVLHASSGPVVSVSANVTSAPPIPEP